MILHTVIYFFKFYDLLLERRPPPILRPPSSELQYSTQSNQSERGHSQPQARPAQPGQSKVHPICSIISSLQRSSFLPFLKNLQMCTFSSFIIAILNLHIHSCLSVPVFVHPVLVGVCESRIKSHFFASLLRSSLSFFYFWTNFIVSFSFFCLAQTHTFLNLISE